MECNVCMHGRQCVYVCIHIIYICVYIYIYAHLPVGQCSIFARRNQQKCCTVPIFLVPSHEKIGTLKHLLALFQACCTVTKNYTKTAKMRCCPKTKNNLLEPVRAPGDRKPQRLGQYSVFAHFAKKNGTVEHFCKKTNKKCWTVPILLVPNHEGLGQYSIFARKLANMMYCPTFLQNEQNVVLSQSFGLLVTRRPHRFQKIVFCFGTASHFGCRGLESH